jgi:hypothetical protein
MRNLAVFLAVSSLTGLMATGGCSSKSGGTGNSTTGGSTTSSNTTTSTGGSTTSSSSSSTSSTTSGTGGTGGSTTTSSGGGPCNVGTSGYSPLSAAPTPNPMTSSCTSADISGFISACIASTATNATCNTWQTNNLAGGMDGGGAGTACGNCIFPSDSQGNATNTGATYTITIGTGANASSFFGPNYGGCVQLLDSTNGAACALAMDNLNNCESQACTFDGLDQCSQSDYDTCVTYVTGTGQGCNTAYNAQSACTADDADGGAAQTCSPSGGTNQTTDFTYIINQFCGTG